MKTECKQVSDAQLQVLLFEQEESAESTVIARHVEMCDTCQMRLSELLSQDETEREASQLLSGFIGADQDRVSTLRSSSLSDDSDRDLDQLLLEAPSHPEMLGRIGRYEIERRVGAGGMGVVFKAIDTELNRTVAIKVLAPHLARNGAARQRFSRESRAAAAVVHEHVVAIHNVDSSGEYPYLVMHYVSGESLQSRVEREGPLSVERILRIGIQAALGLAAAHAQGIVHRDIKPANILLEDGIDRLLITDFGLARTVDDASLTHTGVVAGTPSYMSPEQATGDEVDHRTDLFSLGSVLYFAATGHPPFRAERAMGVLNRICHERHRPVWQVNASIPDELSDVIDRLLEKRPGRRIANAATVAETLTRLLQQVQHRRPSMFARLNSWGRRNRSAAIVSGACALLAIGLAAWSVRLISHSLASLPTRSFHSSSPSESATGSEYGMMMTESGQSNDPQMEMMQESVEAPFGQPTPPAASNDPLDDPLNFIAIGRREFDESMREIDLHLYMLDRMDTNAALREPDSYAVFRDELRLMEQTLKEIDPTVAPKIKK